MNKFKLTTFTSLALTLTLYIGTSQANECLNVPDGVSCVKWNVVNDTKYPIYVKFDAFYKHAYRNEKGEDINIEKEYSDSVVTKTPLYTVGENKASAPGDAYFRPGTWPLTEPNYWRGVVRIWKSDEDKDYYLLPLKRCDIEESDLNGQISISVTKSDLFDKPYIVRIVMPNSRSCSEALVKVSSDYVQEHYGKFWK